MCRRFIPAKKNAPAAAFHKDHGFEHDGGELRTLDRTTVTIAAPRWIPIESPVS